MRIPTKLRQVGVILGAALVVGLFVGRPAMSQNRAETNNDQAELLFQSAMNKELVSGDLQQAIDLYKEIVAKYGSDRPLAAKALLQMGRCYEKLGNDEASNAYERLVRDYADQSEEVGLARARLAALQKPAAKESGMATRQVWTGAGADFEGAPSPDGRYLSFVDWTTGDLAVRDLETGENRRLTNSGQSDGKIERFAMFSRWSPDSKQIAYDWYDGHCCVDLAVVGLEGGKPRTLVNHEDDPWMQTYDWSPDGKQILTFVEEKDGTRQIVLVSATNGASKVLETFEGRGVWPQIIRFSRDGKYIAYDWPQQQNPAEYDIFLIPADGGHEIPLVTHPDDDRLLGWTPDAKGILFASDRTGSMDIWFLPVVGGKAQGAPELIKEGIGDIIPMGFTRSGSFYYAVGQMMLNVYTVRMDPKSGRILAQPQIAIQRFEGKNSWPAYSPDGKFLAYVTTRSSAFQAAGHGNILSIRSLDTGNEKDLRTTFRRLAGPSWSPDGKSLYVAAWDNQGVGIYRVDAQTGKFAPVVRTEPPAVLVDHKVTPDGSALVYEHRDNQAGPHPQYLILSRNLTTGQEKLLYTGPEAGYSISPDGRQLALITFRGEDRILEVMPAVGGEAKELLRSKVSTPYAGWAEWTPDGKYILFPRKSEDKNKQQYAVWRIAAEGGKPQKLNLVMSYFESLRVHPDGEHLVFDSLGFTRKQPAIWLMENFLLPTGGSSSPK